ncbi:hypothetical protein Moror_11284 [Moniliophthora roreri MCA 2997]|uniref:Integral membrane protein n=2 Tax=Moniliophthora roreri TaxID=221103 RepID=V2X1R5_MONRO|nr:hypothetical protein Moror_11284 [Moniliophthora roreri MCA 2997]KAI3619303.1 hypothetical protein WG66_012762 [Moniliophthora roreri]
MAAEDLQISPAFQKHLLIYYPFTLAVMFFLYGFYILLFGMSIHLLRRRKPEDVQPNFYLVCSGALFVLTTVLIVGTTILKYDFAMMDFELVDEDSVTTAINVCYGIYNVLPPFANIVADAILIHRCYLIWGSRKRVAIPLIVLSTVTNVPYIVGCVMVLVSEISPALGGHSSTFWENGQTTLGASQVMSAIFNMILTLLTAGRIWWIDRQARIHGITAGDKILHSVSRIILESGVLYPIVIIIGLVLENTLEPMPLDFLPVLTLFAAIAPTLVIVRARLAVGARNTQAVLSNMRFGTREAGVFTTVSQIQTTMGSSQRSDDPEKAEDAFGQGLLHNELPTLQQ